MRIVLSSIFTLFLACTIYAQDRHFSQFYAAPLYLNPALAGNYDGGFRVGLNYRDQWRGTLDNPFVTTSGYVDLKMNLSLSPSRKDYAAIGAIFFSDKVQAVDFNSNNISIVGAIHKSLDNANNQYLSLGFQFGISSRNVNYEKLSFADQFNGIDGFTELTNEVLPVNNFSYGDLSTGLNYSVRIKKHTTLYAGAAIHHILQPKISFYTDDKGGSSVLNRKISLYAGSELPAGIGFSIIPRIIIMKQAEHLEITTGSNFRALLNDYSGIAIHFGGWLRANKSVDNFMNPDAVILLTGIEYNRILLGFSYDINLGSFSQSRNRQAFEFSIGYLGEKEEEGIVCPKF